jgi:hypothetical protein
VITAANESHDDVIIVKMKHADASALGEAAATGLAVTDAVQLVSNTAMAAHALGQLRNLTGGGRGDLSVELTRAQAAALATIAETGLAVTRALLMLADATDIEAAQRGLDQLRSAMR